jgi:hypothetical protein
MSEEAKSILEIAKDVWESRSNGRLDGMNDSKGGRVWIDGEFQLDELEALCVILRDLAGEKAQGLLEYVKEWDNEDKPSTINDIISLALRRRMESIGCTVDEATLSKRGVYYSLTQAIRQYIVKQCTDRGATCKQFPLETWQHLAASGQCRVGYWDWVWTMADRHRVPLGSLEAVPEQKVPAPSAEERHCAVLVQDLQSVTKVKNDGVVRLRGLVKRYLQAILHDTPKEENPSEGKILSDLQETVLHQFFEDLQIVTGVDLTVLRNCEHVIRHRLELMING